MRFVRIGAPVVVTLALVLTLGACNFGSQGQAGAGGTTNGVFLTARSFTVRLVSMPATYRDGAAWALRWQYAPTDLAVTFSTTSSCPSAVRSCVFAANYGRNRLLGWNACFKNWSGTNPNRYCGQARTRINTYYNPPPRRIACHEIGHSTGLRHTGAQSSCMHQVVSSGSSIRLDDHDRAHLNNHY